MFFDAGPLALIATDQAYIRNDIIAMLKTISEFKSHLNQDKFGEVLAASIRELDDGQQALIVQEISHCQKLTSLFLKLYKQEPPRKKRGGCYIG